LPSEEFNTAAGSAAEQPSLRGAPRGGRLSPEHRAQIDAAIADQLAGWGDARTERETRAWAQRLDPYGAADRARRAATDRRVSIRPAPDCMVYLTSLLPVKDGVAVYGELHRQAMSAACDPDEHRSRGQVMADTLVSRVLTPNRGEPAEPGWSCTW
jgi:hypothetical protein